MFDFTALRDLRKRRQLTIQDVSARSGVSAAVISKLERNQTSAALDTLFKLGKAFEMSATDLLALAEGRTSHKQEAESYESGPFEFKRVRYNNATVIHGHGKTGEQLSDPKSHKDDYELCWVLSGRIRIELPNEKHELGPGDALQFDAVLHHSYEVLEDCEVVIVHQAKAKRF